MEVERATGKLEVEGVQLVEAVKGDDCSYVIDAAAAQSSALLLLHPR